MVFAALSAIKDLATRTRLRHEIRRETNKLQKVTSEPNKDHFRIIEIRPNADPKLVEALISNGTDQGTVKVAKRD
jgi:hypothetical protein